MSIAMRKLVFLTTIAGIVLLASIHMIVRWLDDQGIIAIAVFDGEKSFNLLELQNGRTDLLADVEVPAGVYTQMRIFVTVCGSQLAAVW